MPLHLTPVTVETKVAAPAIATAVVSTLGAAVYALILAFGWLHPSSGQTAALAGMGAAIVYLVQVVVGYLAPHTPRADLAGAPVAYLDPNKAPAVDLAPNKANPVASSVQVIAPAAAALAPAPAAPAPTVAP